ncbi:hypothetical protein AAE478_000454 [Parahypoxylon ruwenzoriense]
MASRNQHLNATLGREVVYCHGCQYEWYRDDRPGTLVCPHCHSDITEIVSLDNDPRTMNDDDSLSDFEHRNHIPFHDSDSDPEEADVEEHIFHGHGGFHGRRAIYRSPDPHGPGNGTRTSPDNREQILRRFQEMLGDMGGGRPTFGRSGPETLFSSPPQVSIRAFSGPGGVGGVSSFTIATGSGRARPGPAGAGMGEDPFQSMLSSLLGNMGPPIDRDAPHPPHPNGGEGEARHPPDFSRALTQLMMTILNPQTIHGDAVYSQEALDRIITNLMEANPQSNAPAPASEEAIAKLSKKKLDEQMLGPELKGECTICIDEMEAGDEAVVLPCKHWFHEHNITRVLFAARRSMARPLVDQEAQFRIHGPSRPVLRLPSDPVLQIDGELTKLLPPIDDKDIDGTPTLLRRILGLHGRLGLEVLLPVVVRRRVRGPAKVEVHPVDHYTGSETNLGEQTGALEHGVNPVHPFDLVTGIFLCPKQYPTERVGAILDDRAPISTLDTSMSRFYE